MMTDADSAAVLMITGDLFFGSKVTGTADALGLKAILVGDVNTAVAKLAEHSCRGVIVDLETPGLVVSELLESLPNEPRPKVIAFASHIQATRLETAKAAGCDEVLSRGQFSSTLPEILSRFA